MWKRFFTNFGWYLSFYLTFTHLWQNQFVDHLFTMTFVDVVHFLFFEWKNDNKFYSDNVIDFWIEDLCESKHAIKYFLFFNVNNSFKINELYYRLECEKQLHFIFTNQNNGHNNPTKKRTYFWFALTYFNQFWHNCIRNSFIGWTISMDISGF